LLYFGDGVLNYFPEFEPQSSRSQELGWQA
jgi:hypothetical protein